MLRFLAARRDLDAFLKRLLDVWVSGVGLFVSLPVWVLVAAAIKLEDFGPVFYRQSRVGMHGEVFKCLKFRSMVVEANGGDRAQPTAADDRRITGVGRFLRRTALDELPQLWNIFCGDMSFVGPRPEWAELVKAFRREIAGFDSRHAVRPGLTGLAQIYGHSEISRWKKLRYDLLYIKRRTLWLDVKLIVFSFWVTFLGRWEHRGPKLTRQPKRKRARGVARFPAESPEVSGGPSPGIAHVDSVSRLV